MGKLWENYDEPADLIFLLFFSHSVPRTPILSQHLTQKASQGPPGVPGTLQLTATQLQDLGSVI
jgi:hypothetical protein